MLVFTDKFYESIFCFCMMIFLSLSWTEEVWRDVCCERIGGCADLQSSTVPPCLPVMPEFVPLCRKCLGWAELIKEFC